MAKEAEVNLERIEYLPPHSAQSPSCTLTRLLYLVCVRDQKTLDIFNFHSQKETPAVAK